VNDARRTGITRELARFIVESRWSSIPTEISHEAKRALLNWAGCAIGGCRDKAVDTALASLSDFAGRPQATVRERSERMDILNAALLNTLSANILDFDDTHLRTVLHPTVPVGAAVIALAEHSRVTGAQLLHAFILGVEVECRVGNAISPEHYNAGWHIAATCGIFGAAAACAELLDLDAKSTAWAWYCREPGPGHHLCARQHDEVAEHGDRGAQRPHGGTTGRPRLYEHRAGP
jgi:2-methylcitrate dehydratase PrpD